MRILQIPNYQPPHIGGIEQVARDIADSILDREDIEQKMICFNEDASDGSYTCRRRETVSDLVDGVEVVRCGCIAKVASQSLSPAYPAELRRILRSFRPDIVILHYPNPFVSTFLIPLLDKDTKLVLYWHLDITKQKTLGKLFHPQTLALCRRAQRIIATSPNYIDGSPYMSRFREKCTVVPNCISTDRFKITSEARAKADKLRRKYAGKKLCLAVGRHVEYKGMTYLVQAAQYLDDDIVVIIGGKGPLSAELRRGITDRDRVKMIGRVDDETLTAYYLACDIFAFPSITKNEAFGIALAEGMYFGAPAVTFNIPGSGVNYVNLDGVTGIECPNRDSRAFAEAINTLARDDELRERLGKAARLRVEENFMFGSFKENINRLIEEI